MYHILLCIAKDAIQQKWHGLGYNAKLYSAP
jgi:hypothetical protein